METRVDCGGTLDGVPLFNSPSSYTPIGTLQCGEQVSVLGKSVGWTEVRTKAGREGYIAQFFVSANSPASDRPKERATEVKGHLLGENMADFLAKEKLPDTVTPCRQVIQNYKPQPHPYGMCDRKRGNDWLACLDQEKQAEDADREYRRCSEHVIGDLAIIQVPSFSDLGGDRGEARFRNGKLVEAHLWFDMMVGFDVINAITAKYGQPQIVHSESGVKDAAFWSMPDSTEISAICGGDVVDVARKMSAIGWEGHLLDIAPTSTEVIFRTKSEAQLARQLAREKFNRPEKNPFDK